MKKVIICSFFLTLAMSLWGAPHARVNPSVRHIQRSMKAMAESTAEKPATIRILFYGQSIVAQGWTRLLINELKKRYPTVQFIVQNRAIGGWGSDSLIRTAESDLFPFYPDLYFFHVYGSLPKYEEIVKEVRERTTAEIVIWSSHMSAKQDPHQMLATRDERTQFIENVSKKYQTMYVDLNQKWANMLIEKGWTAQEPLGDGIHMKSSSFPYYAKFIYEDMVRIPGTDEEKDVNGSFEFVSLSDLRVKHLPDGSLELAFSGNRVEALSDGTGAVDASAVVTLDGKPLSSYKEMWYTSRCGPGPMWHPFCRHVEIDAPAVAEDWTLTYLEGTKKDGSEILYKVEGSVTGFDGTGKTTEDFRSKSGRVVILKEDVRGLKWQYAYTKKNMPKRVSDALPGFTVKWQTVPNFTTPYVPTEKGTRTPLVSNCKNASHTLRVEAKGQKLGLAGFIVYTPSVRTF